MSELGSQKIAADLRDVIERIATGVINKIRPEPFLARVYDVNLNTQKARVVQVGATLANLMTVNFGRDKIPRILMVNRPDLGIDAPGDIVRVGGRPGGYYILDFYAGVPIVDNFSVDYGNKAGSFTLAADGAALHEMNMTGNLALTPTGALGTVAEVRITGSGVLTLVGVTWESASLTVPGSVLLRRFVSGWRAVAIQWPPTVTPAGVTFTDSGLNIITKVNPSETNVDYLVDGTPITFDGSGASAGWAAGLTNVTWAVTGGAIANPAHVDDSWSHTFGALTVAATDPPTIATTPSTVDYTYWNPDLAGALVGTGLSMTLDDAGPDDYDLDQSGASVAVTTTTVNGKTALLFDASTKSMRHLSFPSGKGTNDTDNTRWLVVKMLNVDTTATLGLDFATRNETTGQTRNIRTPAHPAGTFLQDLQCYALNEVIIMAVTVPASGNAKLWVSGLSPQVGTNGNSAAVHAFFAGTAAQFAFCAGGTFHKILSDAEFAGLRSWAQAQWGAT